MMFAGRTTAWTHQLVSEQPECKFASSHITSDGAVAHGEAELTQGGEGGRACKKKGTVVQSVLDIDKDSEVGGRS